MENAKETKRCFKLLCNYFFKTRLYIVCKDKFKVSEGNIHINICETYHTVK